MVREATPMAHHHRRRLRSVAVHLCAADEKGARLQREWLEARQKVAALEAELGERSLPFHPG